LGSKPTEMAQQRPRSGGLDKRTEKGGKGGKEKVRPPHTLHMNWRVNLVCGRRKTKRKEPLGVVVETPTDSLHPSPVPKAWEGVW
jgi:hypothetical protein